MKLTCLSQGDSFHFPPCHMLHICGFQILLECPLDLSALRIFSPIPTNFHQSEKREKYDSSDKSSNWKFGYGKRRKIDHGGSATSKKTVESDDLIGAEPWYKTVKNLHLWDVAMIDIVLVSSPAGMLGLPLLTRNKRFSAKIYATEPTAKLGQLMMDDLVSMHAELTQCYGPNDSGFPQWLTWAELETLTSPIRDVAIGNEGGDIACWQPLYSSAEVQDCIRKVHTLKYAEETCYDGSLIIKAFSSGLEIGASNWTINGPGRNLTYLSSSIFESAHAMGFDYYSLQGNDIILFSDFSYLHNTIGLWKNGDGVDNHAKLESELPVSSLRDIDRESLTDTNESSKEMEKLAFICSCAIDSIRAGGSVLIPIGRIGIVLLFLEQLTQFLDSSNLEVPLFMVSVVAEETLAFANIIPEWLCKQRQEKLYSGEPLFGYVEFMKKKRLHLSHALHSSGLLKNWKEPCIVFAPHWTLRTGPVVHLLRRWHKNENCLLVLEVVDADVALLPFKPVSMKVLQCSFLSGIMKSKVQHLLKTLQPKLVLFPEDLRTRLLPASVNPFSLLFYSENDTLRVPSVRDDIEADLATELAFLLKPRMLRQGDMAVARLKGKLVIEHGKHLLVSAEGSMAVSQEQILQWGSIDLNLLLQALQEKGISGSVDQERDGADNAYVVRVNKPSKGSIQISAKRTVISTTDEALGALIFEAVSSVLDCV